MTLRLTVQDLAAGGGGIDGAAVYVWHCDREGRYSMYSDGVAGENYLRGVQVADADGTVTFTSIFPACYSGRWPHLHVEVYPDVASIPDADHGPRDVAGRGAGGRVCAGLRPAPVGPGVRGTGVTTERAAQAHRPRPRGGPPTGRGSRPRCEPPRRGRPAR